MDIAQKQKLYINFMAVIGMVVINVIKKMQLISLINIL